MASNQAAEHTSPYVFLGMTAATGLVDAVSFLSLGRVFTANMTGSVVLLAFATARVPGLSVTLSLTALVSFLLGAVLRLAPWSLLGALLILAAGFAEGARTWLWLAALLVTYFGAALSGSSGWRIHPSHFAERHGLVIIIALGEAFISIGVGVSGIDIGTGEVLAAILGLLVATSFWLAYFDFFSIRGEQQLGEREGAERIAFARDVYSYLHFPMIVGIVLFAFAAKSIVSHVGDELDAVTAFALCGGCAIFLLTYSAIRSRAERRLRLSRGRFVASVLFLVLLPFATMIPALAVLAIVTGIWFALHAYELVWWRQARAESRSILAAS